MVVATEVEEVNRDSQVVRPRRQHSKGGNSKKNITLLTKSKTKQNTKNHRFDK